MRKIERLMLISIVVVSLYMFLTSFSFPSRVGLLPQIVGGLTVIFGTLLLVRDQLQFDIGTSTTDGVFSVEDTTEEKTDVSEEAEEAGGPKPEWSVDEVALIILVGGYAIAGILVGIFWVTPLFVITFLRWRGHPWIATVVLGGISVLIPYAMMRYLNIDYMSGFLFGGI
jgi:hypothetical protein